MKASEIGRKIFKIRGYLGIPFFVVAIAFASREHAMIGLGLVLTSLGETVRIWSVAYSGRTTRARSITAKVLVTNGPYGFTRNPIYIGNFLIGLGFALASGALWPYLVVAYTVLFWIEYYLIIRAEEDFLLQKFGKLFELYMRLVPRIIPKLKFIPLGKPTRPNFKDAILSERSTLIQIVGVYLVLFLRFRFC
ncbi:MAG: hypothetical protein DRQ10_02900 [Candidatus Hydrothermota bacterium]|nr:MAG: hypothetical protein DRQ10_02900 [Candidatus Hydrothermae bacterium]